MLQTLDIDNLVVHRKAVSSYFSNFHAIWQTSQIVREITSMFVEEHSLGIGGTLQYGCLWEDHGVSKHKLPIYGRQRSSKQIVFRTNILNESFVFPKNVFIVSVFWMSMDVFLFS